MTASRVRAVLAVVAVAALLVACTEEPDPTLPSPTSAFPQESTPPPPGSTGPSGTTDLGPSGATAPGPSGDSLDRGSVSLRITGDVQVERTVRRLITAVYTPPPGTLAIVWSAGGTDATIVGIGGTSFTGTRSTAPTLTLTITAQTTDGIVSFASLGGECDVTIDLATPHRVSGGFTCSGLSSSTGEVVDVSASFHATE